MARIRTIKPEFWTSEQVMECEPVTRLLFIGLWNFCDDYGNHPASPKTIKALVFPGDDIAPATIERMLEELSRNRLIAYYEHSGKRYLHVRGWKHQKIEKPSRKHPAFVEQSPNGEDGDPEDPEVELFASEEDQAGPEKGRPETAKRDPVKREPSKAFESAWKAYPGREGSNPKNKAEAAWRARVKEGVSEEALLAGVIRYHAYCSAKGSVGTSYVMQAQRFFGPGREFDAEWKAASNVTSISRHVGLDKIDHTIGLTDRGDGTYDF